MKARHQRATSDLVALLREKAPPKPACFRSQEDWVMWLHASESAQQFSVIKIVGRTGPGESGRGRIKTDEVRSDIDYCAECEWDHAKAMQAKGKCQPQAWCNPPKAPGSQQPKKDKPAKVKWPSISVVSLNVDTWAPRVFNELADVAKAGFARDAVLLAVRSKQPYKGHYWKLAEDFRKNPPPLPKTSASLQALAAFVVDEQMALPLERD